MPSKRNTFSLYRITLSGGRSVQRDLFEPVIRLPLQQRHLNIDGDRITLWSVYNDQGWLYGQMFRSQPEADECLSGLSGTERPIPLNPEDEEGITGKTHFLYVPDYDVIVLQSATRRVGPGALMRYFSRLAGIEAENVEINPTISLQQFQKYQRMNIISSVSVKLESPERGVPFRSLGVDTDTLIRELTRPNPMIVNVSLSRGHSRHPMDRDESRGLIDRFLRANARSEANVSSLRVRGAASFDDQFDDVDLIQDRMRKKVSVDYNDRGPDTQSSYAACRQVYLDYQQDLRAMFTRRN